MLVSRTNLTYPNYEKVAVPVIDAPADLTRAIPIQVSKYPARLVLYLIHYAYLSLGLPKLFYMYMVLQVSTEQKKKIGLDVLSNSRKPLPFSWNIKHY